MGSLLCGLRLVPIGTAAKLPPPQCISNKKALTSLLQRHQHRLLNEVSLDEAAEVLRVHGKVRQLEGADGHLQQMFAAAVAGDVGPGQGDDG